ncbi:hypothetical protein [Rhodococcus sp. B10]|uniref:hypothetical protein n=1 Tax=Rhodococcus sp. B10 TaxID=2695876 RepID=UPI0014307520|nr:hypothetical protein [Rhodococcus sp. B10]NIL74872.1 hypothetical protein [Rhodococcus sp. B10]
MSDSQKDGTDQITAEWLEVWPQRLDFKYVAVVAIGIICSAGFGVFAVWGAVGSEIGAVGYFGGAIVCLCTAWLSLRSAGVRWVYSSRHVRQCSSSEFGEGIRIGPGVLVINSLIIAMLACGVFFTSVVVAWSLGFESLLPDSRVGLRHYVFSTFCAAASVLVALVLGFFRPSTGLELYPDVVVRTVKHPPFVRIGGDIALPWTSIVEVVDEVKLVSHSWFTNREPLIRLVTTSMMATSGRIGWDTDNYLQLPAGAMSAEPNTLLSVLREMHRSEARRRELLSVDPKTLFSPPPLRKRMWGPKE